MTSPRKIPAIVERIVVHSEDTRTFEFHSLNSLPNVKPGQFLHLAIASFDPSSHWPESRVFSIVSSPLEEKCVSITISKKSNFTSRIFKEVEKGTKVWIKIPYGEFIINPYHKGEIILIAGGTGITPFSFHLLKD